MATFSDGVGGDFEIDSVLLDDGAAYASAGKMRERLQQLLDRKEKQLQQAGTLGQRVLAQQVELEERIRQLQEIDSERGEDDEPSSEVRLRYRELAGTLKSWDEENVHLSSAFGSKSYANGLQSSPVLPISDLPLDIPSHGPSVPSASQSRRAKNAAHRANDVEFAFEIGSSLLTEVRRLQSLLGERDKAIQDMKEEKDDLEKAVEGLRGTLRTQEQNADKYKEENWNLEVTLQELRAQLSDAQAAAQRGEAESKRLNKLLASSRESNDSYKNEVERLKVTIEDTKAKHETDIALHRKQAAALVRDKSDLQSTVDNFKLELARVNRRLPRFGSPFSSSVHGDARTPKIDEDEDDPFVAPSAAASVNRRKFDTSGLFPPDAFGEDSVDNSPEPSPSRPFLAPNHPSNEMEALRQAYSHAQRTISTLKGTISREKELRMDYRRKLIEAGLTERLEEEEEDEIVEVNEPAGRIKATTLRGRGRLRGSGVGRGRGRVATLAHRLNMVAQGVNLSGEATEVSDDTPMEMGDPDAFPSTYLPDMQIPEDSGDGSTGDVLRLMRSPSPVPPSNRTSVASFESMDPAFANVLKRSPSDASARNGGSPVTRGSIRGRGSTIGRRRGGTAYQQPRPNSLVDAPEALAAELGLGAGLIGMESVVEDEVLPEREMQESGCQTDEVEVLAKSQIEQVLSEPLPPDPLPEKAEIGVQVNPEPEPEVVEAVSKIEDVPEIIRSDAIMQTDEPPSRADIATSTDPEIVPILVDSSTITETHLLVPTSEAGVQTPRLQTQDIETQTSPETQDVPDGVQEITLPQTPRRHEAETQTSPRSESFNETPRPSVLAGPGYSRLRYLSSASTVTGPPRVSSMYQLVQDEEDDNQTELAYATGDETEPETETDMDDYHDARSIAPTPSASESVNDFHSISTMTDNDYSGSELGTDDAESIKASVLHAGGRMSRASSMVPSEEAGSSLQRAEYSEQAVGTEASIEEPKRQLSETSIQTDEWKPETTIHIPPPQGFGLYRIGPNSQQFQFISPPPSAPATTSTLPIPPLGSPILQSQSQRDSQATIGARPIRFSSPSLPGDVNRRMSIESAISGATEIGQRQHTQSLSQSISPTIDKTRPPTMMLPPPPKMPPPPNTMPPPSFIPEKRRPGSALSSHRDMPPPRPSSPPPPELVQRATTPTFGSVLTVPGRGLGMNVRQHGSSLPPMNGLRQPPSTTSFRSVVNALAHAQMGTMSSLAAVSLNGDRHLRSATSLLSDQDDIASRRSSISSDFHTRVPESDRRGGAVVNPMTPNKTADTSSSTDPAIIHAITQTMIGEFLYKYTRKTIGKGYGEKRHKRFFWVHPYTRTLYWSSGDPGSTNVTEQNSKSAYIVSVRAVLDPNPMPPGLYQYSVVVSTPQRDMKVTAPTKERHEMWLNALQYLLARPTPNVQSPNAQVNGAPTTPLHAMNHHDNVLPQSIASPMSQRSGRSEQSGMSGESAWNVTPRGERRSRSRVSVGGSVGKRTGTPAAEYLRWADGPGSPTSYSLHGFEHIGPAVDADEDELDFEIHDTAMSDQEGYEGLINVRACCDGRHTVGRSGHIHAHHHHHHHHPPQPQFLKSESSTQDHLQPSRPVSPAFSYRSRASSTKSREGGTGSLFSRFGTRRSRNTQTSAE